MESFEGHFDQADKDNTGVISTQVAQGILAKLGIPFYPGMMNKLVHKINHQGMHQQQISRDDFRMFCDYNLKGIIELLEIRWEIEEVKRYLAEKQAGTQGSQSAGAAPSPDEQSQHIRIDLQVGPDVEYGTKIDIEVKKLSQPKTQWTLLRVFLTPKPEKVGQLIQEVEGFLQTLTSLSDSVEPEIKYLIDSLSTTVSKQSEESVLVQIQLKSQEYKQLVLLSTQMLNATAGTPQVNAQVKVSFETVADAESLFQDQQSGKYNSAFNSSRLTVGYNGSPELLNQCARIYDKKILYELNGSFFGKRPFWLSALLSTEDLVADFKFGNIQEILETRGKDESQSTFVGQIIQMIAHLGEDQDYGFVSQLLESLSSCCKPNARLQLSAGEVQVLVGLRAANLGKIYKKIITAPKQSD